MIMRTTLATIWQSQRPANWLDQKIQGRDNRFDQVRLILALTVVLGHSWYIAVGPDVNVPFVSLTIHGFHQYAVYLFFFISGLLVTESARRREGKLIGFVLARADRIFPGLIVCALLTPPLLMVCGAWENGDVVSALRYSLRLIGLISPEFEVPSFLPNAPFPHAVNGSVWSLRHEAGAYALVGIAAASGVFFQGFTGIGVYTCVLLSISILGHALAGHSASGAAFLLVEGRYVIVAFLLGVLAHRLARWIPICWPVLVTAWMTAALLRSFLPDWATIYAFIATFSYTAIYFSYTGECASGLRYDISYGVYIYGWPVQQLVLMSFMSLTGSPPRPEILFALSLLVLAPIAFASWLLVERPALRHGLQKHLGGKSWRLRGINALNWA